MNKEQALSQMRQKFMSHRRVICTGNPDKPFTIAHGIKKIYPEAKFLHKSNGWDLTDPSLFKQLKEEFTKHNTFINASYIGHRVQHNLLTLCHESVKHCDVVNIGSIHEYDGGGSKEYQDSKIMLRNQSLKLNSYRFKTCHLILGHLNTSIDSHDNQIKIDTVCNMIPWIFNQTFEIPIMAIDNKKLPW